MSRTAKATWKVFEAAIAASWTLAIGLLCRRNILSGANNRTDKGDPRPGDVVIHPDFRANVLLEAKYRSSHAHHKLFREAKADAKKHGFENAILYTRQKNEIGYLAIMEADLFHKMLAIPEVQKLLQRNAETPVPKRPVASKRLDAPEPQG